MWQTSFWSRVSTIATYDKHLSLLHTCHVVETVHLYKCWPFLRFPHAVGTRDTSQRNRLCVFTYQADTCHRIPTTCLYLTSREGTSVCVDNQYQLVRRDTNYTSRGNAITMTRRTSATECPSTNVCQTSSGNSAITTHLDHCTIHNYWCTCQIHQSWKSGLTVNSRKKKTCTLTKYQTSHDMSYRDQNKGSRQTAH